MVTYLRLLPDLFRDPKPPDVGNAVIHVTLQAMWRQSKALIPGYA